MSQPLIITLLLCVFVLPILGAVVLRLLTPRLAPVQLYSAAVLLLAVVIASVLVLARSDIPSLQIGNLSILLPATVPDDSTPRLVPSAPADELPTSLGLATSLPVTPTTVLTATVLPVSTSAPVTATAVLTNTALPLSTSAPVTATDVLTATIVSPTATQAATAEPTAAPTATPEPTAIPPTAVPPTAAPAPPAAQRKYTVQPGDTLLSIAKKFNTTVTAIVEANKLTPQQADALHVGQVLVIP